MRQKQLQEQQKSHDAGSADDEDEDKDDESHDDDEEKVDEEEEEDNSGCVEWRTRNDSKGLTLPSVRWKEKCSYPSSLLCLEIIQCFQLKKFEYKMSHGT